MKTIRLILGIIIGLSVTGNLLAKGAGSSACLTLLQPVSAKVAGMAESYSSVSNDVSAMHYNPATL